jgi:hypothetical protein
MSYREKIAWLSLIAITVTFVPYFVWVSLNQTPIADADRILAFGVAAGSFAVLVGLSHLTARLSADRDERGRADERDRDIDRHAVQIGYCVLLVGVILTGCVMPFTHSGWEIVNATAAAIVLAEIAKYGVAATLYRRRGA